MPTSTSSARPMISRSFGEMAERTQHQAEAARIQAIRAAEMPALRDAEARAAAGLQRLTNARELLDREEERAKERVAEQSSAASPSSRAHIPACSRSKPWNADVALQRLSYTETPS